MTQAMEYRKSITQHIRDILGSERTKDERIEMTFVLAFGGHEYSGIEVLRHLKAKGFTLSVLDGAIQLQPPLRA